MKYIWEAKDIVPGQAYGGLGKEIWIIGYLQWRESVDKYISASTSDGIVTKEKTAEQMAKDLTESGYVPMTLNIPFRN